MLTNYKTPKHKTLVERKLATFAPSAEISHVFPLETAPMYGLQDYMVVVIEQTPTSPRFVAIHTRVVADMGLCDMKVVVE